MSIIVSGSLAYDYIMNFPDSFKNHILPEQLHILSVSFVVNKLERRLGGTAGNIAYTIKLLGSDPTLVSALGKDDEPYIDRLNELGIGTDHIVRDPNCLTASAYITTDADDNQICAFYPGPLKDAMKIDIVALKSDLVLISPTQKDVMIKHLQMAVDAGKTVVFDPGQQITAFSDLELRKLISQADYLIGNDYEIKLIEDRTGLRGKDLMAENTTLITTLGARGSIVSSPTGTVIEVASCPPKSVDDPTGAGDAYRAGFFVGVTKNLPMQSCAQMGAVAATYAIESYGTQEHTFTKQDFVTRYMHTYQEALEL